MVIFAPFAGELSINDTVLAEEGDSFMLVSAMDVPAA